MKDLTRNDPPYYCSPVYQSHPYGYNFLLYLYPYGLDTAKDKSASLFFALYPGSFDALLKWPFNKKAHVSVIDQLDPINKWTCTISPEEHHMEALRRPTSSHHTQLTGIGMVNFIPHTKLFSDTDGYLVNDTLFIEIVLEDKPEPKDINIQPVRLT